MKAKTVFLYLISPLLVFILVAAATAQIRTVGVSVNNTWRYSTSAEWSSTDPTATPPSYVIQYNETEWMEVEIKGISDLNVTAEVTAHFKNGTEDSTAGWIDIDTGDNINMTWMVISANLGVNASIYTVSYNNWFINETAQRTYPYGNRDTNHFNTTSSSEFQYLSSNLYWDKETGILVELFTQNIYQTLNYTTSWSMGLQIISSDVWVIPEFPTWTLTLLMLIALTSATIVIAKQRHCPKTP